MLKATIEINGKREYVYNRNPAFYTKCWMYENGIEVSSIIGDTILKFQDALDDIEHIERNKKMIKRFNDTGVTK